MVSIIIWFLLLYGSSDIWSDVNKNSYNLSNNKPPTDCTDITEVDIVSVSRQDFTDFRQASPTLFHGLNDACTNAPY